MPGTDSAQPSGSTSQLAAPAATQPAATQPDAATSAADVTTAGVAATVRPAARKPARPDDPVAAAIGAWQRDLASHGGPNSLLWFDESAVTLDLTDAHPGGLAMLMSERPTSLNDLYREHSAFAEARERAGAVAQKAAELKAEHGMTCLFLGIGMVRLPVGSRRLAAPLMLRAVDLVPTTTRAGRPDVQLVVDQAFEINPALLDLLGRLGITVDPDLVADAALARSGFDPVGAYRELKRQVELDGLDIDRRLVVSTFTYAKAALAADLADHARQWSRRPLVRLLAGDRGDDVPALPPARLDPDLESEHLVLPLDCEQTRAVDAVVERTDLLVAAPPGTGSTTTVAAAVAAAAGLGRACLLVADAPERLDDVVAALATVGLDHLVVQADDDPRTRRRVIEHVLDVVGRPVPRVEPIDVRRTTDLRRRLAAHRSALHSTREPWGVSAAQAQDAIANLTDAPRPPTTRVRLDPEVLTRTSRDAAETTGRRLADAASRGAWRGGSSGDPWFGARITSAEEAKAAGIVLGRLLSPDGLDRAERLVREMCAEAHLTPSGTVEQWRQDVEAVAGVHATTRVLTVDVYDAPLPELLAATSSSYRDDDSGDLGMWRRMSRRRQARALLRPGQPPADLHSELLRAHEQAQLWRARSGPGTRPVPAASLDAARAALDGVRADLAWLAQRLAGTAGGGGLVELPVADLRARLTDLHEHRDRAIVVPAVGVVLDGARAAGFGALVDDLARRDVPHDHVLAETRFCWWSSVLDAIRADDKRYGEHDGASLRRAREQYAQADADLMRARADAVRALWARRAADVPPAQVRALREELDRSLVRPLAQLWALAPDAFAALPVWASSPVALPLVIPANRDVDLVVIDGADTMTPAVAVGALARAGSALVVGDPAAPVPAPVDVCVSPARAADRAVTDQRDVTDQSGATDRVGTATGLVSALRPHLPVLSLGTVYGRASSRLGSLGGGRQVPTPGGPPPAVVEKVPGTDAALDAETARVVRLVLAHARSRSRRSLGVVTLTQAHAERIAEALRTEQLRLVAEAAESREAKKLAERGLPLVVPAHRLAGRRRDIVLLAPGITGEAGASRGPLGRPDGAALVDAAVGSARSSLAVVTSLTSDDLGRPRAVTDGVSRLRRLLADLEATPSSKTPGPDGPLLIDLADRLRAARLAVRAGVGSPKDGIGVELAVSRPGRAHEHPVAVLTDAVPPGDVGTRERELLWPQALSRRGWRPVHVSTIDLFAAPEPESARVAAAAEGS